MAKKDIDKNLLIDRIKKAYKLKEIKTSQDFWGFPYLLFPLGEVEIISTST